MSLIFDIIILAVCLITIFLGAKRGFVKSVMKLCSSVASLFAAYALYPTLAAYIKENFLHRTVADNIAATIKSITSSGAGANSVSYNIEKLFADMPEAFSQIVARYNADLPQLRDTYGSVADVTEAAVDSLAMAISAPVTDVLANIISFALIFAAAMLVLSIITWILDLIFKLPVLKAANTLLGLIFGVVCALVLAWLMGMVSIYLIGAMSSIYPELFNSTVVQNSVILKFISENNILTFLPASDFLT